MDIVTQEQIDELDGLIEKYKHQKQIEETVACERITLRCYVDVYNLEEKRKNWITLEQCQNIVNAALALLKIMPNTFHFTRFVTECGSEFCFRHLYFASPHFCKKHATTHLFCKEKSSAFIEEIKMGELPDPALYNYDKIVITYTDFDKFIEYIKKSDGAIELDFIKSFWQD